MKRFHLSTWTHSELLLACSSSLQSVSVFPFRNNSDEARPLSSTLSSYGDHFAVPSAATTQFRSQGFSMEPGPIVHCDLLPSTNKEEVLHKLTLRLLNIKFADSIGSCSYFFFSNKRQLFRLFAAPS